MLRRLIVPLDGSPLAEEALAPATALHRATACQVVLYQAEDLRESYAGAGRAAAYLAEVAARLAREGVAAPRTEVSPGPAHVAIPGAIRRLRADLVVMTTHGSSGFVDAVLCGSIASAVIRSSPVPVLAWRARGGGAADTPPLLEHVLVPVDGSERSGAVLGRLVDLLGATNLARVTLLSVPASAEGVPPIEARLVEVARSGTGLGIPTVGTVCRAAPDPAAAIADEARSARASLVAMATRPRSGITRYLFGSVTDEVVRRADVPVLVLRGD